MKSRYSAFASGNAKYIIDTTHPNNPDFTSDIKAWLTSIMEFSKHTEFLSLEILEFIEADEEAFVTFKATLSGGDMVEKSRFLKVNGSWFYESGEVTINR